MNDRRIGAAEGRDILASIARRFLIVVEASGWLEEEFDKIYDNRRSAAMAYWTGAYSALAAVSPSSWLITKELLDMLAGGDMVAIARTLIAAGDKAALQ